MSTPAQQPASTVARSGTTAVRVRVGGGYKNIQADTAAEAMHAKELQRAKDETASAKQQVLRLQLKVADAKQRLSEMYSALAICEAKLRTQASMHQEQVEQLITRAEVAEAALRQAQARPHDEFPSTPNAALERSLHEEQAARLRAEHALEEATLAASFVAETEMPSLRARLDEALRRSADLGEELGARVHALEDEEWTATPASALSHRHTRRCPLLTGG